MSNETSPAINANITLLEARLRRAVNLVAEARDAASRGEMNLAIGTLMPAEEDINDAVALLKTVLVLHRSRHDTERVTL